MKQQFQETNDATATICVQIRRLNDFETTDINKWHLNATNRLDLGQQNSKIRETSYLLTEHIHF